MEVVMSTLDYKDKAFLKDVFNQQGYVLDFSTTKFDRFTLESINDALCEKYHLSKGASLAMYIDEAPDYKVRKLILDLCEYYHYNFIIKESYIDGKTSLKEREYNLQKCKDIASSLSEHGYINVDSPITSSIDFKYISQMVKRAKKDISNKDYDSALTKSRTLLEEVFCYVIEEHKQEIVSRGNVSKLYAQVKTILNMHINKSADKRINDLLSGLNKVVESIGSMRSDAGDAHGRKKYSIEEHHARLYVNSAMTFAEFVLSVHLNKQAKED